MLVRSILYPNIERVLASGQKIRFKNGLAEMDASDALSLALDPKHYEIVKETTELATKIPFRPASWSKEHKIIWDGWFGYPNGYGKSSMHFVESLSDLTDIYPVYSNYHSSFTAHSSEKLQRILQKSLSEIDTFYIRMKSGYDLKDMPAQRSIGFTMFEATKIRPEWVENINKLERCLVPCNQNKEAFIESGVDVDIEVIPLGVSDDYHYIDRPDEEPFVFSTMGNLTNRKGTDLLVKAFIKTFPQSVYPNVSLYIKSNRIQGIGNAFFITPELVKSDPRITVTFEMQTPEQLVGYFKLVDCFVFPTRGEGFGLPPLEAMATGLPVICTNWSGCADFLNDKVAYPLNYKLVDCPAPDQPGGFGPNLTTPGMQWAEPDFEHLCELMKHVYEHRTEAKAKGKKAAAYVAKNWTYDRAAQKLVRYLNAKF